MEVIVACATDNGKEFADKHFGDADFYMLYKISRKRYLYIKEIRNTSEEEKIHGDSRKAKSIREILCKENVQVLLSKRFGPNILSIKKFFVPVLVRSNEIKDGLEILLKNFDKVIEEWNRGDERNYIILR